MATRRGAETETSGLQQQLVPALEELFELLNASARKLDVKATRGLALRRHYQQVFSGKYTPRNGALVVTWGDPEPALEKDTLEAIDPAAPEPGHRGDQPDADQGGARAEVLRRET